MIVVLWEPPVSEGCYLRLLQAEIRDAVLLPTMEMVWCHKVWTLNRKSISYRSHGYTGDRLDRGAGWSTMDIQYTCTEVCVLNVREGGKVKTCYSWLVYSTVLQYCSRPLITAAMIRDVSWNMVLIFKFTIFNLAVLFICFAVTCGHTSACPRCPPRVTIWTHHSLTHTLTRIHTNREIAEGAVETVNHVKWKPMTSTSVTVSEIKSLPVKKSQSHHFIKTPVGQA